MVNFELSLPILKKNYVDINREILRFDFQYNSYQIYFLYRPTLVEGGKGLFVFNADVDGNFICQPLAFVDNKISASINPEIFQDFFKISNLPTIFFNDVNNKILTGNVIYTHSTSREMIDNFNAFYEKFPKIEVDKPFFWRFTTQKMSPKMENKLFNNGLTKNQIYFLKEAGRTAQFTFKASSERNILIALNTLKK